MSFAQLLTPVTVRERENTYYVVIDFPSLGKKEVFPFFFPGEKLRFFLFSLPALHSHSALIYVKISMFFYIVPNRFFTYSYVFGQN